MNWNVWWLYLTMDTVLCLTPGPAVMLVLANAIKHGARRTTFTILGIISANALYFVLSATSLGALLVASYNTFFLVKWIGAGYLIYLGLRAMFSRSALIAENNATSNRVTSPLRLYVNGVVSQAANPKALVFFAALLPQFIDPKRPIALQVAILGITSVVVEFVIQVCYAAAADRASTVAREPRFAAWTNRISGALLISAGTGIALLKRE